MNPHPDLWGYRPADANAAPRHQPCTIVRHGAKGDYTDVVGQVLGNFDANHICERHNATLRPVPVWRDVDAETLRTLRHGSILWVRIDGRTELAEFWQRYEGFKIIRSGLVYSRDRVTHVMPLEQPGDPV